MKEMNHIIQFSGFCQQSHILSNQWHFLDKDKVCQNLEICNAIDYKLATF
jgi:hypothetical protein